MSSSTDRNSNHDRVQHEQGVHGEASDQHGGHSGEGAASAMARMIQQDQKHRRQTGEDENDAPQG